MATYVYEGKKIDMKKAIKAGLVGSAMYGTHSFFKVGYKAATKLGKLNPFATFGLLVFDAVMCINTGSLVYSTINKIEQAIEGAKEELNKEEEDE